jgi:predicted kinase
MLHGFVGSGKTTFAKKLETELPAFRFSPDEWMTTLFGTNPPASEFQVLESRTMELIQRQYERALALGNHVVLDFGFWRRAQRDQIRKWASNHGYNTILYSLRCSDDSTLTRVADRNRRAAQEGAFEIDEAALTLFRQRMEELGEDEHHTPVITDPTG